MDNVVAVGMPKGGVGKTTTAVNLVASLARMGKRACLVDNDWQGSATVHGGLKSPEELTPTWADVLMGRVAADRAIRTAPDGYDLLPANGDLVNVDLALVEMGTRGVYQMREALAPLAARYDVVVIDCEPGMHVRNLGALAAADYVLTPVSADYLSLKPLSLWVRVLRAAQQQYQMPNHRVGVIATRVQSRQSQAIEVVEILRRQAPSYGLEWLGVIIPERAAHRRAAAAGTAIHDSRDTDLVDAYNELARRVLEW